MRTMYAIFFGVFFLNPIYSQQKDKGQSPIGVFDSGTGGLTILQAILTLDAFNNNTGKPGSDGVPDFINESFQYLADQANMPYGNYAAVNKTALLKEHILKNVKFLLQKNYEVHHSEKREFQQKPTVKMVVIACNTATAYAIGDIKKYVAAENSQIPVIGVIDAGCRAAIQTQQKGINGTIGVFATAGTVASEGYPRTLKAMAAKLGLTQLSIISQGGVGVAESIDRDYNYFSDTIYAVRNDYKGPSVRNEKYTIDTLLLNAYRFNKNDNKLLCEYDSAGRCLDMQLNDPSNYVRYHLVSLLEKMKKENYSLPLSTLILGCTHYPYLKDTIGSVLKELYNYRNSGGFVYRKFLSPDVVLIDPGVETAKEAYVTMRMQKISSQLKNKLSNQFFISVPNTTLKDIELQPDGWFTYAYKYGRSEGANKEYIKYVPFDTKNIAAATYNRFRLVLPDVYMHLRKVVHGLDE